MWVRSDWAEFEFWLSLESLWKLVWRCTEPPWHVSHLVSCKSGAEVHEVFRNAFLGFCAGMWRRPFEQHLSGQRETEVSGLPELPEVAKKKHKRHNV